MTAEYHRLGDYIREVNVRNRELKVTELLGVSVEKNFFPSIANTIGTDMSNYKIVQKRQFVYIADTSRRGDKIAVALLEDCDEAIISQAYTVFEVVYSEKLLPEYLMMWFRRPEFDRYARFHSHGSAREVFDWDELCDVLLSVPDIERQREIVAEYETLTKRIHLNEQMIARLEATAQALYRHTFVDNIDKQNLPQGWQLATLGEVGEIVSGATPKTEIPEYWSDNNNEGIAWISPADLSKQGTLYIARGNKSITNAGYNSCSTKMLPAGSMLFSSRAPIGLMAIAANEVCTNQGFKSIVLKEDYMREYLYMTLQNEKDIIAGEGSGSTFDEISAQTFKNYTITLPSNEVILVFHNQVEPIFHAINLKQQENIKLTELQSLLLAKMGR
ncbi:MAG: restriction endonuclease subunit S [Synergistales bacterium]|nr:restriction endonuclease subunit S [Bacteroidales bacterium]MDY6394528.1 restriction endonuclease subunit S [Bacteroidales bacterium]MDY6402493.1 restriction endonuclease subunit S [Bacteroidales bacterium]MDY6424401.1 restriction endonuclease subunit S [Bacteroidales bacterium]MDY6435738.1 restriction endonuclease subunit S [Synergistales bacterium]